MLQAYNEQRVHEYVLRHGTYAYCSILHGEDIHEHEEYGQLLTRMHWPFSLRTYISGSTGAIEVGRRMYAVVGGISTEHGT
jgi:hypothetical protein